MTGIRTFSRTSNQGLKSGSLMLQGGVALDSTLRPVVDKAGTASPLQLSTTAVRISTGDFTVANGNIAVAGKVTSTGGYSNTSGTVVSSFEGSTTFSAAAGSANFRPVSISYTINNSGAQTGTATGIFLNATETALNGMAHNFATFQRGGVTYFNVTRTGLVESAGLSFSSGGTSSGRILAVTNGVFVMYNSGATDFTRLNFGAQDATRPALQVNGTTLEVRLADGSGFAPLSCGAFTVSGSSSFIGGLGATSGNSSANSLNYNVIPAAGSANFRIKDVSYTINASGAQSGTVTGIYLNVTETALNGITHNLMDLQRSGSSLFTINRNGAVISQSIIYGTSFLSLAHSTGWTTPSDGVITLRDSSGSSFSRLNFGGTSNSFPALVRQGNTLEVRTADGLTYAQLHAGSLAVSGYLFATLSTRYFIDQDSRGVAFNSSVGIRGGNTPNDASAILDVASTIKGVLFPRMTTAQKNAIASPATGLIVFDTDLGKLCVFSTTWQTITSA